jgi:uncharacterized repeat protein (TIGR03803 family)
MPKAPLNSYWIPITHGRVTSLLCLVCASSAIAPAGAQAQATYSETVLHSFPSPWPKGSAPSNVIRDSAGNLYGTTQDNGPGNAGVVFKVSPAGHQTRAL